MVRSSLLTTPGQQQVSQPELRAPLKLLFNSLHTGLGGRITSREEQQAEMHSCPFNFGQLPSGLTTLKNTLSSVFVEGITEVKSYSENTLDAMNSKPKCIYLLKNAGIKGTIVVMFTDVKNVGKTKKQMNYAAPRNAKLEHISSALRYSTQQTARTFIACICRQQSSPVLVQHDRTWKSFLSRRYPGEWSTCKRSDRTAMSPL